MSDSSRPSPTGKVDTTVTYLEMAALAPLELVIPCVNEVEIKREEKPSLEFYRFLYDGVGRNYTWTARKLMRDEDLAAIMHDDAVEITVLYIEGKPAGFVELDCRKAPEVEISMFGIFPEHHGKRLGPWLLNWAIAHAWGHKKPKRLWLHTCTLDHHKALAMYERAGFVRYDSREESVDLI